MSTKFYVYGGGRWRELDLNTGRVSGWAKSARIVVARNGRLECSRNTPILRALRALAAGEPSRARDGPRLPHTRWREERQSQKQYPNSPCQHCCHHRYTAVVENVCKHVPPAPPVRPSHVLPMSHQPEPSSTHVRGTDEIFDKLRNECVNPPEQNSISAQVHSPQKRATRASSISKNKLHSAPHRFKRQRVSSSSSVEYLENDISTEISRQGNGKRIQPDKEEKKLERRGRPPKKSPANILGVVAAAVPNLNSRQPLCITSGKWNCTSTLNKTNIQPNRDISRTKQSPEPSHIAVQRTTNEDSQATSDKSDNNVDSDGSGKRDDEESQQTTETSALLAHKLHSGGHAAAGGQSRQHETTETTKVCKELVIEESDVIALRGFLRRNAPGVSLNRFDSDDEYKRGIFYRLHPLVSLERSGRIQQILSENDDISLRDFASQLGLRSISDDPLPRRETPNGTIIKTSRARKQPDRYSEVLPQSSKSPVKKFFASRKSLSRKKTSSKSSTPSKTRAHKNVGLKSSPLAKPTSHENARSKLLPSLKTTARKKTDLLSQSPSPIKTVPRENDMSKSSAPTKKITREHALAKLLGSSNIRTHRNMSKSSALKETTDREVALNSSAPKILAHENGASSKTAVTLSSDEGAPKSRALPQPIASPLRDQPPRKLKSAEPARASRAVKEYSPSEDAAIVTWVSSEGRARLVNGNRMWRDLQDHYERLTGIWRTWQSLRNRYLRYILPSLSSLAVPPASAARLRAAAATGEIKSKRRPARRNSIFATPGVRGAWSRRPRSSPAPHAASPTRGERSPHPPPHDEGDRGPSSDNKAVQRKRSTSASSSSSSTSSSSVRYPTLRYSDVTRQFAKRHQTRHSTESSESRARSPSPARTATRTRRLFNPKSAL